MQIPSMAPSEPFLTPRRCRDTSPPANAHRTTHPSYFSETRARAIGSAPAHCGPAFQRTRRCSQHLEERLIIVHRSSRARAHTITRFSHANIHLHTVSLVNADFIGAMQVPKLENLA